MPVVQHQPDDLSVLLCRAAGLIFSVKTQNVNDEVSLSLQVVSSLQFTFSRSNEKLLLHVPLRSLFAFLLVGTCSSESSADSLINNVALKSK